MSEQDCCNIYGGFTIYAKWGEIQGELSNQEDLKKTLEGKVDKEPGKSLSANDYTNAEKSKVSSALQGIKGNGATINPDSNRVVNITPANIGAVPNTRKINGKALLSDVNLFSYGTGNPSGGRDGDLYFKYS